VSVLALVVKKEMVHAKARRREDEVEAVYHAEARRRGGALFTAA